MTVSTTQNRVSYAGNGVTSAFSFPYVFFDNADLVVLNVKADGTFTQAVLGTDYTVTGAGVDAGGTVTMTTAPAAGATLVIYRDPALVQPQAFVDNDPLPAKAISRGYDRQTVIAQRIRELVDRSFRLSDADTSGASPVLPTPTPNAFIGWDGLGTGLMNRSITDLITISAYGTAVADKFVGDGAKVDFTLSANPGALGNLDVSISGITQEAGRDFTWDGATKLSFVSAPPAPGTPGDTNIYVRYLRALPQGYSDASIVNWKDNAGVARDVESTLQRLTRDVVSVKDPRFGARGDGIADDTAAIQAAVNSFAGFAGTVYFPRGVYRITAPITVSMNGMQLVGESPLSSYLSSNGGTFDLLRIAGAYCRVENLHFSPGGNQYCIRLYAAHCVVENNRFLASANNTGTAILLTDVDPATGGSVAGAYAHEISLNVIGYSGYAFARCIDDGSNAGMTACKFNGNQMCSDAPIRFTRGGANTYVGNLFQSSTGSYSVPAGTAIDLGANVLAEKLFGNYFERYQYGVLMRNPSGTYQLAHMVGNHYDTVTNDAASTGSGNYVFHNPDNNRNYQNGWVDDYSSATYREFKTPGGINAFGYTSTGFFCAGGLTSTAYHQIRQLGSQGGVIFGVAGGARDCYFQIVDGAGGNGANTALNLGANSSTLRSLNAGGTVNASGADYAEYMRKAVGCGTVAKGAIVGVDGNGELTDQWAAAVAFLVKSTDPSYVGGDTWASHLERPREPAPPEDETPEAVAAYEAAHQQFAADFAQWEADLEAARQTVDRVAFAGQVPVNVYGAVPGQYIVPVQDGDGIKGTAKSEAEMTLAEYMCAVGKVIAIEADGRARIIVKAS
jgi:hypothetical protein